MIWLWKFHFLHPICKQWAVADPIQNTVQRVPCHCVDFVGILSRHLINYSTSKYSKRIDYYFQLHPCSVLGTLNIIFWLHHKRSKVFLWPINRKKKQMHSFACDNRRFPSQIALQHSSASGHCIARCKHNETDICSHICYLEELLLPNASETYFLYTSQSWSHILYPKNEVYNDTKLLNRWKDNA